MNAKPFGRNIRLISHGVDYDHIAKVQHSILPIPSDMPHIPRPIAGYVGEIKPLDFELVRLSGPSAS